MDTMASETDRAEEESTVSPEAPGPRGRLEPIDDLREAWPREDEDFTPWLAENLDVLEETLGIELELEAREKSVGSFRADVLCREVGSDSRVLIENQLERTDHTHLGQLLTYAAGLEAVTVIWTAKSFTDEHRAALDWLNGITDERFRFFGLEIELWRIGDSVPAPKFNVVSQPNDWSREVSRAAADGELSETQVKQREYWDEFHEVVRNMGRGDILGKRTPQPASWMGYGVGRADFRIGVVMRRPKKRIQTELYISGGDAKTFFSLLQQQKDEIEREYDHSFDWQELPEKQDCRIADVLDDVDPFDESDWPRQHEWLADRLIAMHRVFSDRVRDLDVADWRSDD